jgi:Cu-Zn family superoxide dismutase
MKFTAVMSGMLVIGMVTVGQAETGKAMLMGTSSGVEVSGTVMLQDTPQGLKIDADIAKAPAGQHAFHIHEFGLCDDQGKAAGSHYNPAGHMHGNALKDGIMKTHAGDFGSITVNANGMGSLHAVVPGLALSTGQSPVAGRAFILHEKMDDFSQPTGNAGGRIGCGLITITGK